MSQIKMLHISVRNFDTFSPARVIKYERVTNFQFYWYIPAKFHDFSVMLTNLKDSHDLTIVF